MCSALLQGEYSNLASYVLNVFQSVLARGAFPKIKKLERLINLNFSDEIHEKFQEICPQNRQKVI
jgi:hypothetical protein